VAARGLRDEVGGIRAATGTARLLRSCASFHSGLMVSG